MSKQRIAANLLIMGAGQIATWVLSTIYLVMVSRYLGPDRQGELSLAVSIVTVLGLVVNLGMETLITRTVARTPERGAAIASTAIVVRGILALPVFVALYIYAQIAGLNLETRQAAYFVAFGMILTAFGGVMLATFQGREQMSRLTIGTVLQGALTLGLALLIRLFHGGVVAFAIVQVVVPLVLLVLTLRWMRGVARLTWRVSRRQVQDLITGSLAFWASNAFLTVYMYIDSVILFSLAGTRAVGFYAPATRMFTVALFLPTIVGSVTLPQLSRLGVDAGSDFTRAARKTLSLLIACAVPITVGLATFAAPLILAVFGSAYQPAVPALVVLSLCIPCTFLNIQFAQSLAAREQQHLWTIVMAASCVVNPLINLALIPLAEREWHNGALGAALALLVTEILMAVYGAIVLRDVVFDRSLGRATAGALAAGAAQGLVLWLTSSWWSPLGEVLGVVVYGALAILFGAVSRNDAALLLGTVTRRVPGSHNRRTSSSATATKHMSAFTGEQALAASRDHSLVGTPER